MIPRYKKSAEVHAAAMSFTKMIGAFAHQVSPISTGNSRAALLKSLASTDLSELILGNN